MNRPIPVIPLLVGGAAMPEPSQLPENIRALVYKNAVRVDSGRDFDHHMNGLIGATDKILGKAQTNIPASSTLSDFVSNDAKNDASNRSSRDRAAQQPVFPSCWRCYDYDLVSCISAGSWPT